MIAGHLEGYVNRAETHGYDAILELGNVQPAYLNPDQVRHLRAAALLFGQAMHEIRLLREGK